MTCHQPVTPGRRARSVSVWAHLLDLTRQTGSRPHQAEHASQDVPNLGEFIPANLPSRRPARVMRGA